MIAFVTARCNARCPFCLYGAQLQAPDAGTDELTVAEYEAIARQYGPLHYLALSGGEPFLRRDLDGICEAFLRDCNTQVVDIPSNLSLGPRMLETLDHLTARWPDRVFELQASLDDLGEGHDQLRAVPGLFERARANLQDLAALRARRPNLRLKALVVWLPENRNRMANIIPGIEALVPWDRLSLTIPHHPEPSFGPLTAPAADDLVAWDRTCRELGLPRGGRGPWERGMRAANALARERLLDTANGRPMGRDCGAGRDIVVLGETGEVWPCEPLFESIGNVRKHGHDLGAVLDGPANQAFAAQHLGPTSECNCTWGCAAVNAVASKRRTPLHVALRMLAPGR